jgi:hypothetical protein
MARVARRAGHAVRKGVPHKLTPQRAAQIHRWQMLGAAARKGQKKAGRSAHHSVQAKNRKSVASSYAAAAKWGVAKLILPTSLVTPLVPGYQPGDRTRGSAKKRRG